MRPNLQTLARRLPRATRPDGHPGAQGVTNVAHRGASAYAPENTLASVRKAVALDADVVEVDVQRSRDGVLVLLHDATLERTTDARRVFPARAPWRVQDFTFAELRRLDAGSWKAKEYAGERIPTLAETLEVLALGGVGALVELKSPRLQPGIAADVADVVLAAGIEHRVTIQSCDELAMRRVKEHAPSLRVGLLGTPSPSRLAGLATWVDQVNSHHQRVSRSYVAAVRDSGMECNVWTVNRESSMHRAVGHGVDGVITDRPDLLHAMRQAGSAGAV